MKRSISLALMLMSLSVFAQPYYSNSSATVWPTLTDVPVKVNAHLYNVASNNGAYDPTSIFNTAFSYFQAHGSKIHYYYAGVDKDRTDCDATYAFLTDDGVFTSPAVSIHDCGGGRIRFPIAYHPDYYFQYVQATHARVPTQSHDVTYAYRQESCYPYTENAGFENDIYTGMLNNLEGGIAWDTRSGESSNSIKFSGLYGYPLVADLYTETSKTLALTTPGVNGYSMGFSPAACVRATYSNSYLCAEKAIDQSVNHMKVRITRTSSSSPGPHTVACTATSTMNCFVNVTLPGSETVNNEYLPISTGVPFSYTLVADASRHRLWLTYVNNLFTSDNDGQTWTFRGAVGNLWAQSMQAIYGGGPRYRYSGVPLAGAYDPVTDSIVYVVDHESSWDGSYSTGGMGIWWALADPTGAGPSSCYGGGGTASSVQYVKVVAIPAGTTGLSTCPDPNFFGCVDIGTARDANNAYTKWKVQSIYTSSAKTTNIGTDPFFTPTGIESSLVCGAKTSTGTPSYGVCNFVYNNGNPERSLTKMTFAHSVPSSPASTDPRFALYSYVIHAGEISETGTPPLAVYAAKAISNRMNAINTTSNAGGVVTMNTETVGLWGAITSKVDTYTDPMRLDYVSTGGSVGTGWAWDNFGTNYAINTSEIFQSDGFGPYVVTRRKVSSN